MDHIKAMFAGLLAGVDNPVPEVPVEERRAKVPPPVETQKKVVSKPIPKVSALGFAADQLQSKPQGWLQDHEERTGQW